MEGGHTEMAVSWWMLHTESLLLSPAKLMILGRVGTSGALSAFNDRPYEITDEQQRRRCRQSDGRHQVPPKYNQNHAPHLVNNLRLHFPYRVVTLQFPLYYPFHSRSGC